MGIKSKSMVLSRDESRAQESRRLGFLACKGLQTSF